MQSSSLFASIQKLSYFNWIFIVILLERKLILIYLFVVIVAKHIRFCLWIIVLHNPCQLKSYDSCWYQAFACKCLPLQLVFETWNSIMVFMAITVSEKGGL